MLKELILRIHTDWKESLFQECRLSYFNLLNNYVSYAYSKYKIFPKQDNIFKAFNFFNIKDTKVVLLGQDPYHNFNQANGLSFGVDNNNNIPPSLKNIAKELKDDLNITLTDYSLIKWAKQYILLLNTNLTVQAHKPLSHQNFGWQTLVLNQIKHLLNINPNVIFLCWGKHAQNLIFPLRPKFIIASAHPSPFSANNFFGTKPFSKINKILNTLNQSIVNW